MKIFEDDPGATALGKSLIKLLGESSEADSISQSFSDCFRPKASSTLQKRSGSLHRFAQAFRLKSWKPLRFTVGQLYEHLCDMRAWGLGATSAQHLIEALFFLEGTAKFISLDLRTVVSGRCKGVARDMYLTKDPLEQKQPLLVSHVRKLEHLIKHLPSREACILGQLLFCVHACCRWKDSLRLRSINLERGQSETLVHAVALKSKTTQTAEARTRSLPYVALGSGVSGEDWATCWIDARAAERLDRYPEFLPSFSESRGEWITDPMSAPEATCWMREFLSTIDVPTESLHSYATHSCKPTLLTWAGRSTEVVFSPGERRLMGHHVKPGMKSVLTYSREAYTALYGKVLAMFAKIRAGSFNPDLPAVDRVLQAAQSSACGPPSEHTDAVQEPAAQDGKDSSSESSIDSEADTPFLV